MSERQKAKEKRERQMQRVRRGGREREREGGRERKRGGGREREKEKCLGCTERQIKQRLCSITMAPIYLPNPQEVQPGINQYMFTCVQKHEVWSDEEFWCSALYKAVQSELVRVYSEFPVASRRRSGSIVYRQLMSGQ